MTEGEPQPDTEKEARIKKTFEIVANSKGSVFPDFINETVMPGTVAIFWMTPQDFPGQERESETVTMQALSELTSKVVNEGRLNEERDKYIFEINGETTSFSAFRMDNYHRNVLTWEEAVRASKK